MKVILLAIALVIITTVHAMPADSVTEDSASNSEDTTQEPLDQRKESELEPSEFHYPLFLIKYPAYHGFYGHHGYNRPYWHHWHGGNGWGPHYGGYWGGHRPYYGGGIGNTWPWIY